VETLQRTRVGAYVVCVRGGSVLLSRFTRSARWSLPGGGLDHGEPPEDGAVREVEEETGYRVALGALLGVHSSLWAGGEVHALQIVYRGEVVGGELRDEVGGSSDRAEWVPLGAVPTLDRTRIVDLGLDAARS
jgi:8-oxo-dGTP diphosphatase